MREKIHSYLGFAKRSGNLITGYNTCVSAINKKKLKLLILTSDISENTMKKMMKESEKNKVPYRVYGNADEISQITGCEGRGIFGITDENFSNIIAKEIDEARSQEEEVF
jgi:ribosomal protein L7Ae-like RNA K-turn-binding protein